MELEVFVVDAFTSEQFKGNSAAVIYLQEWLSAELMQKIAAENNLSETAFLKELSPNQYQIRWFSPLTEIDFCGHATLASAFIFYNQFKYTGELEFVTEQVGSLFVKQQEDGLIEMSFPNQLPEEIEKLPEALIKGLSIQPIKVLKNRQAYFAVMASEAQVNDVIYNAELLKSLAPYDVVVTAPGSKYDFVSRYFWPANGGEEDPVTGSIHSGLAPYWAAQLDKTALTALQASKRSGVLYCQLQGERVLVSGDAVLYLQGKIWV